MDRLAEIKERYRFLGASGEDMKWLVDQVDTLRQAAHADQIIIQRLRGEVDHWVGVAKTAVPMEALEGGLLAENQRLAALTGSLATEAEVLKRECDDLQAKLARVNQRAVSRAGKVPK